ncbi:carbohydrate esterase family 16 protein [Dendrothele bispora CBS 962.96]|uniref:Carbohydrate esterase family 16 protein n=1 Tax=Dendrothele bispora (strain CBS 962.96) TaxID=1314807 RepID=A0A4V4HBD2_DENBC|nr:carbohydrate esterase family 16 protein [Dendrothele bispora CBS 962.96]
MASFALLLPVTFGDSYTDTTAFTSHGIASWPVYTAAYTNVTLHSFAKAGAVCSQAITPNPLPDVNVTLFTVWIGTNDLGVLGLLIGNNMPGKSLVDTSACAVGLIKTLYENGARNFLFQQVIPLQLVPIYTSHSYPNRYWTAPRNTTEWELVMAQYSRAANGLSTYMLRDLIPTLPEAHVGIFNTYDFFSDIYSNPQNYLNGTAPPNVEIPARSCIFQTDDRSESIMGKGNCTEAKGSERDSYMWWDELHPSEQTGRSLAAQVAEVISMGKNEWTTWLS